MSSSGTSPDSGTAGETGEPWSLARISRTIVMAFCALAVFSLTYEFLYTRYQRWRSARDKAKHKASDFRTDAEILAARSRQQTIQEAATYITKARRRQQVQKDFEEVAARAGVRALGQGSFLDDPYERRLERQRDIQRRQNEAYQQALEEDADTKAQVLEAERLANVAQARKQARIQRRQDRLKKEYNLVPEPAADSTSAVKVTLKFPDGSRHTRRFDGATHTISHVREWVHSFKITTLDDFVLVVFPRRQLDNPQQTVGEADIAGSLVLVQPQVDESDSETDE